MKTVWITGNLSLPCKVKPDGLVICDLTVSRLHLRPSYIWWWFGSHLDEHTPYYLIIVLCRLYRQSFLLVICMGCPLSLGRWAFPFSHYLVPLQRRPMYTEGLFWDVRHCVSFLRCLCACVHRSFFKSQARWDNGTCNQADRQLHTELTGKWMVEKSQAQAAGRPTLASFFFSTTFSTVRLSHLYNPRSTEHNPCVHYGGMTEKWTWT